MVGITMSLSKLPHAFQRVMAGMAEVCLNPNDSFWSWRDLMYKIVQKLSPEQANVIATQLYIDMLKAGYTQVGEFHYLHHELRTKVKLALSIRHTLIWNCKVNVNKP